MLTYLRLSPILLVFTRIGPAWPGCLMDPRFKFWRYITCLYVLDCVTDPKSSLMIYFSYLQTHDLMIFSVYYMLISDEGSFVLNLLHTLDELYGYSYNRKCFISYPPLSLYS